MPIGSTNRPNLLAQVLSEATREVQWNVTPGMVVFMYASMVLAMAAFGYGTWRRYRIWRIGQPELRWDRPAQRIRLVLVNAIGHAALLRERVPGIMHALIFFGFAVLFMATVVVWVHDTLGIPIMRGRFYLYFQSLTVNLFGAFTMVGVGIAAYRRYIARLSRLELGQWADGALLAAIFAILASGFLLSGLRIEATSDPWALWRPVSFVFGRAAVRVWSETSALERVHALTWVVHVGMWHALMALIPFSKLFHAVSSTLNVYFANLDAKGLVPAIDFDDPDAVEVLGVRTPLDLTWKQLLDLDACTECGRCQDVCPAWATGKPLSPKRVILDLRDHVRSEARALLVADGLRRRGETDAFAEARTGLTPLAGGVIRPETLWACTTCRACEEVCPVSIEHVRLIVQMRRNLAMDQAEMPQDLAESMSNLEQRFHPFRGAPADRAEWYRAATATMDPD